MTGAGLCSCTSVLRLTCISTSTCPNCIRGLKWFLTYSFRKAPLFYTSCFACLSGRRSFRADTYANLGYLHPDEAFTKEKCRAIPAFVNQIPSQDADPIAMWLQDCLPCIGSTQVRFEFIAAVHSDSTVPTFYYVSLVRMSLCSTTRLLH